MESENKTVQLPIPEMINKLDEAYQEEEEQ